MDITSHRDQGPTSCSDGPSSSTSPQGLLTARGWPTAVLDRACTNGNLTERPFVITSECPWPARNGVTAKTARLLRSFPVEPIVICPEHEAGLPDDHLHTSGASPKRHPVMRAKRVIGAGLRRGWVVQPGLERARVLAEVRSALRGAVPQFVHFDTVATEHLLAPIRAMLAQQGIRVPMVLSINDSISDLCRWRPRRSGLLGRLDVRMMEAAERRAYPSADAVDVVAPRDIESVLRIAPSARTRLIPLGATTEATPRGSLRTERPVDLVVFSNSIDWSLLSADVLPRLRAKNSQARVVLLGVVATSADAQILDTLHVEAVGYVDDLRDLLGSTRVVLAPSQQLAGTPNKARDGLANGAAVVGGSCLLGLPGFVDGVHGLIASTGVGMADHVDALLADEPRRLSLALAGHELVSQYPDWASIGQLYVEELPSTAASAL